MDEKIIELASTQGIWTVLRVALLFYILKNQEKRDPRQEHREKKYQETISNLTDKSNLVEDVKKNVEDIKEHVFRKQA